MGLLQGAHGQLHDALVVVRTGALLVLLGGHTEQKHCRNPEPVRLAGPFSTACEIDIRSIPGIASTGVRPSPSCTNIG